VASGDGGMRFNLELILYQNMLEPSGLSGLK
jgi:hypothetical protein